MDESLTSSMTSFCQVRKVHMSSKMGTVHDSVIFLEIELPL